MLTPTLQEIKNRIEDKTHDQRSKAEQVFLNEIRLLNEHPKIQEAMVELRETMKIFSSPPDVCPTCGRPFDDDD